MINEFLWFILLFVNFLLIIFAYKYFGKTGLYIWTAMAVILANIQVMKTISIFGLTTALGNIVYSSMFLVTDILNENYSKNEAQRAVWIGFFVLISTTIIMQLTLFFQPSVEDVLGDSLKNIFTFMPRIALASLSAYLLSQHHDVFIFQKLKNLFGKKKLWLRNNLSTITSQLIDNVVFTLIAFTGIYSWQVIFEIFITSYILKMVVAFFDTPFVYWARKIKFYRKSVI